MQHFIFPFLTRLILLCFTWQTIAPSVLFATADVAFEVSRDKSNKLLLSLKEKDRSIISTFDLDSLKDKQTFGRTTLERDNNRFLLHYISSDTDAQMGVVIQANGDMELHNSMDLSMAPTADDECELYEPAVTLNDQKWTWEFTTPGTLTNTANLLFHIVNTHAREFHNFGIIKARTAKMTQNYKFNVGVFDFGDGITPIDESAYAEQLAAIAAVYPDPQPNFTPGTVDDYGLFLSLKGHTIRGLKYRVCGVYLNEGDLTLEKAEFIAHAIKLKENASEKSSPDTHACCIAGLIRGESPLIRIEKDMYSGGFAHSLRLKHLAIAEGATLHLHKDQGPGRSNQSRQNFPDTQEAFIEAMSDPEKIEEFKQKLPELSDNFKNITRLPFETIDNLGEVVCSGELRARVRGKLPSDIGKMTAVSFGMDILKDVDKEALRYGNGNPAPTKINARIRTKKTTKITTEYWLTIVTEYWKEDALGHRTLEKTTRDGPNLQKVDVCTSVENFYEDGHNVSAQEAINGGQRHRKALDQIKENIRKNLYKLAAAGAHKNDLMYGLMQALIGAGLGAEAIEGILSDPEIESLLGSIAGWSDADENERAFLTDKSTLVGRVLFHAANVSQRMGIDLVSWAKENPYHVLSLAFVTAAMAPTAGPPAMATAAAGRVVVGFLGAERARAIALTGGMLSAGTQAALKQRHTFFSEEAKKGTRASANPKPGKAPTVPNSRPVESSFYSTYCKIEISPQNWTSSRRSHFQEANEKLYQKIRGEPGFAQMIERAIPGITKFVSPGPRGAFKQSSPAGFTWHHKCDEPGVLELIPRAHHVSGGAVYHNLHPGGHGGMSIWGGR